MPLAQALRNPLVRIALACLVAIVALFAAWRWTPLADFVTAERVIDWAESLARFWWAPAALAFSFTPASVVMFPRPLLTLAAVMAFGPWEGFAVAMSGVLLNALLLYLIGRYGAKDRIEKWGGARLARVGKLLRKEGFVAVATVGLLPVAPFVIEALAFGALRLKLRHVLPGVAVAMTPGILGAVLMGDQIAAALSQDRSVNRAVIVGTVVGMAAIMLLTRRYWRKLQMAVA